MICEGVHEICKKEKKYFSICFNFRVWTRHRQSSSEIPMNAKAKKNISKLKELETLYLLLDIVFISRHCIYFEALYLFRDIVFISRHCINFETLY